MNTVPITGATFAEQLSGNFKGMLHWEQLDDLWQRVRAEPQGWYASLVGQDVPQAPLDAQALNHFVDEVDALLRREHKHEFCGIVYVDKSEHPTFIKIFDPHNLGSSCSCSATPIPPRWVLSRMKPERIEDDATLPSSRRSWWSRLFGASAS